MMNFSIFSWGKRGAVLLAFLAACATPPTTTPVPTSTSVPPPTPLPLATETATPLPTPTPGPVVFTIGLPGAPISLDPANAVDEAALLITRHIYEGLTAYEPGTTRVVPALAQSWETSPDGLTWTFHLRPDAQFSDGTPLTATAVTQNIERWWRAQPPASYAFWRLMFGGFAGQAGANGKPLSRLVGVGVVDAATLTMTLTYSDAALPATLAMPAFAIVNPAAIGQLESASAGSGPFALQDRSPEGIVQLVRNPRYSGSAPLPDEVIFKPIADDTQRLLALQVGEIDGMARVNPRDYATANAGTTRLEFDPALSVLYLGFNHAHAPWDNLNCRLAVNAALNPQRYAAEFFPGDADVAAAFIPPAVWGAPMTDGSSAYDPAQAQQHWAACVTAVGPARMPKSINFYVPPERAYVPNPMGLGQAIQADLLAVGISVTLTTPDWPLWLTDVQTGQADIYLIGWSGVNGDPDSFLCPVLCGVEGALNNLKGQPVPPNPELAQVLQQARATFNPDERLKLYQQAHDLLRATVPIIPLAHRKTAWAYRREVIGNVAGPVENLFFGLQLAPQP